LRGPKVVGERFDEFRSFARVAAVAPATGKRRWKKVFADKGINQLGHLSTWQVYDLDPARPTEFGGETFPGYGSHRVWG
jgi:hypothetical protein